MLGFSDRCLRIEAVASARVIAIRWPVAAATCAARHESHRERWTVGVALRSQGWAVEAEITHVEIGASRPRRVGFGSRPVD